MTFDEAMIKANETYCVRRQGWMCKSVRGRYSGIDDTSLGLWLEQWGSEAMQAGLSPQAPYEPSDEERAAIDWEISPQEPGK